MTEKKSLIVRIRRGELANIIVMSDISVHHIATDDLFISRLLTNDIIREEELLARIKREHGC